MKRTILSICLLLSGFARGQQSGFATADDHQMFYQKFGETGLPVLIINGGPGMDSRGFEFLAKKIAGFSCQTIIYDQRGTGQSVLRKLDSSTITMDKMVADIEALRKHLGFERWVVLGHSFGGMLANYYASQFPEHVQALIASSSGGLDLLLLEGFDITRPLSPTQRDSFHFYSNQLSAGDTSELVRKKRYEYLAAAYLVDESNVPTVAKRMQQGNMHLNRLVWQDLRRMRFNCKPALSNFEQPVLIIQGTEDILNTTVAQVAQQTFPNAQVLLLENCGHYGWLDRPKTYFSVIENFLKKMQI